MPDLCIRNPFTIAIISDVENFCNRNREREELLRYARSGQNVVIFAPRRIGKSSLVHIVQNELKEEGYITIYADFYSVITEKDVVSRMASSFAAGIGHGLDFKTMLEKIGQFFSKLAVTIEPTADGPRFGVKLDPNARSEQHIEDLLADLHRYATKNGLRVQVAFDEFQELTILPEAKRIEGALRAQIQQHGDISYFFIGSRRRILKDMFSDKSRPFYKSAFSLNLGVIDEKEFVPFIVGKFHDSGKSCSAEIASEIYDSMRGFSYYIQKLCFVIWEITEHHVEKDILNQARRKLIKMEENDFIGVWSGLTLNQKKLLRAIAEEPIASPYGKEFLAKHDLSQGGVQRSLTALLEDDIIEQNSADNMFRVTDPVMEAWVKEGSNA